MRVQNRYSPHAWGWTDTRGWSRHSLSVFPTRVGMDRSAVIQSTHQHRIPHTRGDGPLANQHTIFVCEYSPHAWGWTVEPSPLFTLKNVFPTRVGMDRAADRYEINANRIPHTRGDGPITPVGAYDMLMYSPHAWGWTQSRGNIGTASGVFPTRVGMDQPSPRFAQYLHSIPHTRGDGPLAR